jgi:YidC/Oxa1 family membrane protein insertase
MFMLGSFASGLVLYWITNNVITFIQQYIIMRSHGHKPDLFGNIKAGFKRGDPAANSGAKPSRAATKPAPAAQAKPATQGAAKPKAATKPASRTAPTSAKRGPRRGRPAPDKPSDQ